MNGLFLPLAAKRRRSAGGGGVPPAGPGLTIAELDGDLGYLGPGFGSMIPDTVDGVVISFVVNLTPNQLSVGFVGNVKIPGVDRIIATMPGLPGGPFILDWSDPDENYYGPAAGVGAYFAANLGNTVPLTLASPVSLDEQVAAILAGTKGFALDPHDLSTMWQDTAGTVPVLVAGQPIGRISGKWGAAPLVYQANNGGAARPALSTDGMVFDGVDDLLRTPAPVDTFRDVPAAGFTARLIPGTTTGGVFAYFSQDVASVERVGARIQSANIRNDRAPIDAGTNTRTTPNGVVTPGVPLVLSSTADFINDRFLRTFVNGVAGPFTAMLTPAGNSSDTASAVAHIGRPNTLNTWYVGTVGRMVFYPFAPTPEQLAVFEAWVADVPPAIPLDQQVLDILAGTPGFRIDPSNLATMFQDSAGTIPVTANGQPVGRINTEGGTTVSNFNQPTVAAQPTLANLNALLGDGVDDILGGPTPWVFVNMPALFLCFEAELVAYPPVNRGMHGFSNNQTVFVQLNVNEVGAISVSMINSLGPPASANGVMLVGQKHVVTLICDWTTEGRYEVFVDGVVVTSVVRGPTTAPAHSNINRHRLMSNIANTIAPVNAKVGRLVLSNQLMTPTQKAVLEAWVAAGPFDPAPPAAPAPAWRMPEDFSTLPPDGGVVAHNGQDWRNISLIPNLWEPGIFGWEAET